MLSADDKLKIELEETYRSEIKSTLGKKSSIDIIETVIKILQGIAIIAGIIVTLTAYKAQLDEEKNREQRRLEQEQERLEQTAREYRKYFYENQFRLYAEATEAAAILATEQINSVDYLQARKTFYRLYWGQLSIVEDKCVENKMVHFERLLRVYESGKKDTTFTLHDQCSDRQYRYSGLVTRSDLQQASLRLAHTASSYTIHVWVDSLERKNYNR